MRPALRELPAAAPLALAVLYACSGTSAVAPTPDAGVDASPGNTTAGSPGGTAARDASTGADAADAATPDSSGGINLDWDPPATCGATIPALKLTKVAEGFTRPIYVTAAPGDTTRLYVLEQDGQIRIVKNGVTNSMPFLDVNPLVADYYTGSEEGLLGLAFHPNYAQNGRFFISYVTDTARRSIVAEYRRSAADPERADTTAVGNPLIVVTQPFANHNGGMIDFGPDGRLVLGLGDGGDGNDPQNHGQTITSKLGKLLRLDVDNPTVAPSGNMGNGADPFVFAYGLRNPWRFSHDRKTGDIYIGDVGQRNYEEIDVNPGGVAGRNYGWKCREGLHPNPNIPACTSPDAVDPVVEHGAGAPPTFASITGGYVYRGRSIPCLRGRYLYGDFGTGGVHTFKWNGGTGVVERKNLTSDLMPIAPFNVASFGQDNDGEVYVVEYAPGRVHRVDAK